MMFAKTCCPNSQLSDQTGSHTIKPSRTALVFRPHYAEISCTIKSANKRARQDKTKIPWAVAGACAWAGVEGPDTMQGCTLLNELEPGDRAPDTSERLPDLQ